MLHGRYMKKVLLAIFFALVPFGTHAAGTLVKSPSYSAVYYLGEDGKRYVFPSESVYSSWYPDFSGVTTITDEQLYSSPIGGNVTYKPGSKMVKITTDPKVYAVDRNGTLRWIVGEDVAVSLYGADWAMKVQDIPDAFFTNYTVGTPITNPKDFSPSMTVADISADKALGASGTALSVQTEPQAILNAPTAKNEASSVVVEATTSSPITFIKEPFIFTQVGSGAYFLGYKADRPLKYAFDEVSRETNPPFSIGRAAESYWGQYTDWVREMGGYLTEVLGLEPKSIYSLKVDFEDEQGNKATRTINYTTP